MIAALRGQRLYQPMIMSLATIHFLKTQKYSSGECRAFYVQIKHLYLRLKHRNLVQTTYFSSLSLTNRIRHIIKSYHTFVIRSIAMARSHLLMMRLDWQLSQGLLCAPATTVSITTFTYKRLKNLNFKAVL